MIQVLILIPKNSNDGEAFLPGHHAQFEAFVIDRFGGLTRVGNAQGVWVDAGTTYVDDTTCYVVAMGSITNGGKLAEVVAFAKAHYEQEAIYISYLGLSEIL